MIRVRFATGLVVEYKDATYVEIHTNDKGGTRFILYRNQNGKEWVASIPMGANCAVEAGETQVTYYHTGTYPERVLAHLEGKG